MGFMDWFFNRKKQPSAKTVQPSSNKFKYNRLNYSRIYHPDILYDEQFNSITFIYDPFNKKLYSKPYPSVHAKLSEEVPQLAGTYDHSHNSKPIKMGFILGRFGTFPPPESFKAIAFWNVHFENNDLVDCLNAIIDEYPEYGDPNTLVLTDRTTYYDKKTPNFKVANLENIPGVHTTNTTTQSKQQKPECNVTLDVLGQPTSLGTIMGNFHMTKDDRLPAMKSAICSQGVNMKDDLEKAGCDVQVRMLDDLIQKSNCNSNEYENLKSAGRINRKQYLKNLFRNPEKAEREFRTQRDIDSAWDELQQKEHRMIGFAEWLNKYSL